jgi:DNA-binding LytR/AlgR family response regulator
MKINCIIIEDEPLALERLTNFVQKLPSLNLMAALVDTQDALVFIKSNSVDLIFLDINLGEVSGIQFIENSTINSQVIFTTAYDEFALKGYELNVTDYLLKPFTFERFVQAIDKVEEKNKTSSSTVDKKFIFVKTEYRLEKIMLEDILFIEGMRDYRKIHTTSKSIMTLQTFYDFEKEIPSNNICRVHKSYMIAIDKIESIERDRIKIKEHVIPISETYKQGFYRLIEK